MSRITFEGDTCGAESGSGETILAAALRAGVPVAHACGGKAKCTTCRVIVLTGLETCSERTDAESTMARARHLTPQVRLACQTVPAGDVVVRRLVTDDEDASLVREEVQGGGVESLGEERRLAILFCDVRSFTSFAEAQPAYDVVHVLNRWFRRAHAAVARHGGRIDAYLGDGILARFGEDGTPGAALAATRAGVDLVAEAKAFGTWFEAHFHRPFGIGVGVHVGEAILGTLGSGDGRRLTVVGDAVNLASRVESANRDAGTALLVTEDVRREAGEALTLGRRLDLPIKGKTGVHALYEVLAVRDTGGR